MDPLSEVIGLLRPHATLAKPISGRGSWAVRYAAHGAPSFCLVAEGSCWLALGDAAPLRLEGGDFLLLPATPAFWMGSDPNAWARSGQPQPQGVHHGQTGPPDFRMLGGSFQVAEAHAALLGKLLPAPLHVRADQAHAHRFAALVGLLVDESQAQRPGHGAILARLVEVLLVEALRWPADGARAWPPGLLRALQDPALREALAAMHADVRHPWTVAELAQRVGLSRSAFAKRFREGLGDAPMAYLGAWRLALAQEALRRGGASQAAIAEAVGFESASAFSTAFRRRTGLAPGAYARALARAGVAPRG